MRKIVTQGIEIYTFKQNEDDYISLTDLARYKNKERTDYIIQNWMRKSRDNWVSGYLGKNKQLYF